MKQIVIIGGGFGGIQTALALEKQNLPNTKITLVHNKYHFEFHGALYRTMTGRSPMETCIPLQQIFEGKNVEVIEDDIWDVQVQKEVIMEGDQEHVRVYTLLGSTESMRKCDYLVLALGMETNYFNIPGLEACSFGFKTINDALRLKQHLHEVLEQAGKGDQTQQANAGHIVVVGAGSSGVEAAGALVGYARELALVHGIDQKKVRIDLVEAKKRILPNMSEAFSAKMEERLKELGVNIFTNAAVMEVDAEGLYLKNTQIQTKTVVWTAGVKAHTLYQKLDLEEYDVQGRVHVDDLFQPKGLEDMFVIGDGAATRDSGMAQTALANGQYVANIIGDRIHGRASAMSQCAQKSMIHPIPIGPKWAGVLWGRRMLFGRMGWFVRRYFDWKVFHMFLPFGKAVQAFREGGVVCETCPKCLSDNTKDL